MNIDWQTGGPPSDILLMVKVDDYMGEYTMKATRKDYMPPTPGQCKKGFRKGWRWVDGNGDRLDRKETPIAWAYINNTK